MAWEPPGILPIDDPTKPPIVNKDVLPPQITVDPHDAVGLDCAYRVTMSNHELLFTPWFVPVDAETLPHREVEVQNRRA